MLPPQQSASCSARALRHDLNERAAVFARRHSLSCERGAGRAPSLLFTEDSTGLHGNFHPASYRAIRANLVWNERLAKAHTAWRRAWPRADWQWRELDCAVSSDALLMNIFCYPRLLRTSGLASLLGIDRGSVPAFGIHPRLQCVRGITDTTEIDMQIGDLLVEAKLTESGFQKAPAALLARFANWEEILDPSELFTHADGSYANYQLIRGVLAAASTGARFCLLCDGRRTDLIAQWFAVLSAVRSTALRCRLKLLTWQEVTAALPKPLQLWVAEKYGIASSGNYLL